MDRSAARDATITLLALFAGIGGIVGLLMALAWLATAIGLGWFALFVVTCAVCGLWYSIYREFSNRDEYGGGGML